MKRVLIAICLFGSFLTAQAGEEFIYRFEKNHKCDSETSVCSYDFFLTTKEELSITNEMVRYLPIDQRTKSKLVEIHNNKDKYPQSILVINRAKKSTGIDKSALMTFAIDCKSMKFRPMGTLTFTDFFAKGEKIKKEIIPELWFPITTQLMQMAAGQLCNK